MLSEKFEDNKIAIRNRKSKNGRELGLWYLTFNIISVISWRSVLLRAETGVPGENHRTAASH